ncbi:MAG: DUF2460 domain-containing protein [Xenococcaceae cyanobacterium]
MALSQIPHRFDISRALYPDTVIGSEARSQTISISNGYYQHVFNTSDPRLRWQLGGNTYTSSELDLIRQWFYYARGRCRSFSFRDSSDYKLNETLTPDPSNNTQYPIIKRYGSAIRRIYRPVTKTSKVYVNNTQITAGFTIDKSNGIIVFNTAPTGTVRIETEFDCLVRFNSDSFSSSFEAFDLHTNEALYQVSNLELIETFPLAPFPEINEQPEVIEPVVIILPEIGSGSNTEVEPEPVTVFHLLDIPLRRDSDIDYCLYVAASGTDNWVAAELLVDTDGNGEYEFTDIPLYESAFGTAIAALSPLSPSFIDNTNTVEIQLYKPEMTLESIPEDTWMAGNRNIALLGSELICYKNATLTAPGRYRLSGLIRGVKGTEYACITHVAGEGFYLLDEVTTVPTSVTYVGSQVRFKAVVDDQSADEVDEVSIIYNGNSARPPSVVDIRGTRDNEGNLAIAWSPRSRRGMPLLDYQDLPVEKSDEFFLIEIVGGRTLSSFSNTVTYSAAMQIEDFGSVQSSVEVRVVHVGLLESRDAIATL